jgi:predicted amidohydrolase
MIKNRSLSGIVLYTGLILRLAFSGEEGKANLIPNGDFQGGIVNGLPRGWSTNAPRPSLAPIFRLEEENNRRFLYASGGGNPDCSGWISTRIMIELGKTYWFRARFRISGDLNPLQHLVFQVVTDKGSQGIAEFHRLEDNWALGEGRVCFQGQGTIPAEARIIFRLCAEGKLWIESVSLSETTPVPQRWVRVACTQGPYRLEDYGLEAFRKALDVCGEGKTDLALLPEYCSGEGTTETLSGVSAQLMSEKARQYRMYVAGTIGRYDPLTDRLYNSALLFDRQGNLMGLYDKIHLYGPELHEGGVTPGTKVPVFQTDFGKLGFMTCYDSWFADVAELVALKGADILLFPNLGYDRGLMHTRALDNCINVVTSSRSGGYGVWDAVGRDLVNLPSESGQDSYYKDLVRIPVANMGVLMVTLDLNAPRNQEMNGGTRMPVPRSKRHIANMRFFLEQEIQREKERWWVETISLSSFPSSSRTP